MWFFVSVIIDFVVVTNYTCTDKYAHSFSTECDTMAPRYLD